MISQALTKIKQESIQDAAKIIYFCGCNCLLQNRNQFKLHVQNEHNGEFVYGSSHYLTITTSIVLPVKVWKKESIEFFKHRHLQPEDQSKVQKPKDKNKNINKAPNLNEKLETQLQQRRSPRIQNTIKYAKQVQNNERNEISQNQIKKKTLQWNQFLLIPNQTNNPADFFCGNCSNEFPDIQKFVFHCFDQCQELEHPLSTYRIDIRIEKEKNQNQKEAFVKRFRTNPLEPMLLMKKQMLKNANNDEKFICGCGSFDYTYKNQLAYHILSHRQILPQNSSHVILRIFKSKDRKGRFFMILFRNEDQAEQSGIKWFCPCKPEKILKRNELVLHIRKIHQGISPKYFDQ